MEARIVGNEGGVEHGSRGKLGNGGKFGIKDASGSQKWVWRQSCWCI